MPRIAIIDLHPLMRRGLRDFLADFTDLEVVVEGAGEADALVIATRGDIDVLMLDISASVQNGVDALAVIRDRSDLPILVFSSIPAEQCAATLLTQGASGYLAMDCDPQEIVKALRHVATGRRYITREVSELLAACVGPCPPAAALHLSLSKRELQVFLRLAGGETIGRVATQKSLSVKTVSTYRTRLLRKLGMTTNSQLTKYALQQGLIQ